MTRRYGDYRIAGDRWFPPPPAHWTDAPVWTMFTRTTRKDFPHERLLSVYRDHGVVPRDSRDDNRNRASEDLSTYQLVEPGDLVVNKMKAWQGSLSVSRHRGIVSPAYFVYTPHHSADDRFLNYLLRSETMIAAYIGMSKGVRIGQWDLEPQQFSRLKLAMPPLAEQSTIADFLDRETAKVDAMVSEQLGLIEVLRERRKAVLDRATSAAGGPRTRMKFLYAPSSEANRPDEEILSVYREYGVIPKSSRNDNINQTPENVQRYLFVRPGDLVVNRMKAWQGSLGVSAHRGIVSGDYEVLRPLDSRLEPMYVHLYLRSPRMVTEYAVRSTGIRPGQWRLYWDQLGAIEIPVPTLGEQRRIVAFVEDQTARIDSLIGEAEGIVAVSKERRTALISAAVTGQIDVRGEVA